MTTRAKLYRRHDDGGASEAFAVELIDAWRGRLLWLCGVLWAITVVSAVVIALECV